MKITKKWLKTENACESGVKWFNYNFSTGGEIKTVAEKLMTENHFDWANWLLTHKMNRKQRLGYAIFAAEQVIDIFERKYPNDKRPREAIEAAKKVLKNDTPKNRKAARAAARAADVADVAYAANAVNAAANVAYAANAAYAAVNAARVAYVAYVAYAANAAYAAANAAANAADAADAAATAAAAVYAAARVAAYAAATIKTKIINYGLKLLREKK